MGRQKWEYCTLVHNADEKRAELDGVPVECPDGVYNEYFNVLGAEGWEMCGCFGQTSEDYLTTFFKRPKADAEG